MNDQKNMLLAIGLSVLVIIGWQYFVGMPQLEKQRQQQVQQQQAQQQQQTQTTPSTTPQPGTQQSGTTPQVPGQATAGGNLTREAALATSPRVLIDTPTMKGSVSLKGGRIDDIALVKYRETVDPNSPPIVLLAPSGSAHPFYAQFGWTNAAGAKAKLPDDNTVWTQEGRGALSVGKPITLTYDNGEGLEFRRTIAVDENYLFTLNDTVVNRGSEPVTLYPYALISRQGRPEVLGYYILHEGLVGVMGDKGLQEFSYSKIESEKQVSFDVTNGWLGITDKYWAATLLPETDAKLKVNFSARDLNNRKAYQTDYLLDPVTIAAGGTGTAKARLFAGAKEVSVVDGYDNALKLNRFELLIDWGWFYFITKPMFWMLDFFFKFFGNFGIAILIVTVIIKIVFFPLANKSYASMAKMKAVQPQMMQLRERYADDKVKQQQALMELYKQEKINPLAGCLPILVQIPVFFALYKVLFITIEMRHAPFFGWIHDLAAPDPTTIFNLFGLIPWDPSVVPVIGPHLMLGIWPLIMGVTMWFQMKLNPAPPDPTQKMIFDWMPLIFTFMLATFPAGLVIYWAWNNTLSVLQQSFIMKKHGAKIELWDNILELFGRKKTQTPSS
ncbi:membrane protein insertase YidC [Pseudorhodoplanes sinuspersici]|uniref:Membrane protein insertase YidC n=1 Tax=Pseudorhodoplanes sinuspersici TaxID=1235591 RepID=A0A1W6ZZV7_9HYPH|nr:membrane protein insertase YidC [Pseudorhodoplanes sinuspersici]ARQ02917.1 membrane protein insertase YidC [Pseudorhodoplanes sinuspersici]